MSPKNRPKVIAGNWKMYKTIEEAIDYVETLTPLIKKSQGSVYLAVPFTALYPTAQKMKELKSPITLGAQNMNDASEGAFTGEIAAKMLVDAGADFVILGHSERRHIFHESDELINKKVKQALKNELQPILCVGETFEEREQERTEEVLQKQLTKGLKGVGVKALSTLILAYEPVWAIGTGKVAEPADAQAAHLFCRRFLSEKIGEEAALRLTILYGGSVKPENAAELLAQEEIDGVLVGGASLSPQLFSQIIKAYKKKSSKSETA